MGFSQPFSHTNDKLKQYDSQQPEEHIKTSFYKNNVLGLINRNPSADRFLVGVAKHPTDKAAFIIRAVSGTQLLEEIMGDFPCPNQCVPPAAGPYHNAFSKEDIMNAMSHTGCFLFVVHFASLKNEDLFEDSTSIYGVTGSFINPVPRYEKGDNIYISIVPIDVP